jgi:hypothetical protein
VNAAGRAALSLALFLTTCAACTARSSRSSRSSVDASVDADVDREHPPDPRVAICPGSDAAAAPPTFAEVQQILDENCISCHGIGASLELMGAEAWTNLVNQPAPAPEGCGGVLVTPGDPDGSYLYQKLSSSAPCYGAQMPLGEFSSDPLPACVVAIVRRWIAAGAPGPAADGGDAGAEDGATAAAD